MTLRAWAANSRDMCAHRVHVVSKFSGEDAFCPVGFHDTALSPNDLPQQLGADHIVALSEESLAEQVQKLTDGKVTIWCFDPIDGEVTGPGRSCGGNRPPGWSTSATAQA